MLHFPRWKVLAILAVVLAGVVFALPNILPRPWQDTLRDYTGLRPMTRGLDLQGGTSLLMEIDGKDLRDTLIARQLGDVRAILRHETIAYEGLERTAKGVKVTISDANAGDRANELIGRLTQPVEDSAGATVPTFEVTRAGQQFTFVLTEPGLQARTSQAVDAALKILGYRLNGLGITEASLQRQGLDRILIQVPGLGGIEGGGIEGVKGALGQTGAVAFQMLCESQPAAASDTPPEDCVAYPRKEDPQQLIWVQTASRAGVDGNDIANAQAVTDSVTNEPIVSFKFNQEGTRRFAELTEKNVGKPFAIVLDGQILSAPRINEPIYGGSGQISGIFAPTEANNLAIALRSGALPARLVYIDAANESAGGGPAKRSDL